MPMIDVYAPSDLFPDGVDREIAEGLTLALLRAEGVQHPARFSSTTQPPTFIA
jgi:hypothetical protein